MDSDSWEIEDFALDDLTKDELAGFTKSANRFSVEVMPRTTPLTPDLLRIYLGSPDTIRRFHLVRDPKGDVLGYSTTSRDAGETNMHILRAVVSVAPPHRRQGIGTQLIRHVAEIAVDMGRVYLQGEAWDTVAAGIAFAKSLGASLEIQNHMNWIEVPAVDQELMLHWIDDGPKRAPGYEVVVVEEVFPDVYFEGFANLMTIIEQDAPMPLQREARQWDAASIKEFYDHMLQGVEVVTACPIHRETGHMAGMSQLIRPKEAPKTIVTTFTVVDPDHRGHALGKWIKAAVILRAFDRWPDASEIETMNAFTNDAMLGINHEMGFQHDYAVNTYQARAEEVLDRLTL